MRRLPNPQNTRVLPLLVCSTLLLFCASLSSSPLLARQDDCGDGVSLQHSFVSGASWSLCASVDNNHGLRVSSVHYRAPGDSLRSVLADAHLGQLLLHYHDSAQAEPQVNTSQPNADDTATSRPIKFTDASCPGVRLGTTSEPDSLCEIIKNNRTLAKFAQRPSLNSQSWELASAISRDALVWTTAITFTEDGQIRPAVRLSGRASRNNTDTRFASALPSGLPSLTRAAVRSTWRMVFDVDTDSADRIEQFDFPLDAQRGNVRPMQISAVNTEALLNVNRETFRGWRMVDGGGGAGYYLDPANSGFSYTSRSNNWAQFDMAFTRLNTCEQYASLNVQTSNQECGNNLDDFVNGESLINSTPVAWYSQMRNMDLTLEDWPVISEFALTFDLIPFDWTASSPFELIE